MAFNSRRLSFARIPLPLRPLIVAALCLSGAPAVAGDPVFDELRFGTSFNIDRANGESGTFPSVTLFFDPFGNAAAVDWTEKLLRPRVHLGAQASTTGDANAVYAGFTWTANLTDKAFLELGFGGTLHDGKLEHDGTSGPKLGCPLLFHESVAAGYDVTRNWRIVAQVEHSSHANLCGDSNSGLSRAGILIGYKF